jgi:hypothetical protein
MTDNNSIITRSSTKTPQVLDSYNSAIKEHTRNKLPHPTNSRPQQNSHIKPKTQNRKQLKIVRVSSYVIVIRYSTLSSKKNSLFNSANYRTIAKK